MNVQNHIDPAAHAELHRDADRATAVLEDALGQSAGLVKAEWSVVEVPGPNGPRTAVKLALHDPFIGPDSRLFDPLELKQPDPLWWRLHNFWGDMLQQRTNKRLERLDQMVGDLERESSVAKQHQL